MSPEALSAFLITAFVLTMAPGLDTAMVLRSAAADGVRHGAATAFGIAIGCLCWGGAAAFGLGALLAAWPLAFEVLKWAGAAYLAWLGLRLLFRPRRIFSAGAALVGKAPSVASSVRGGFTTNILNPKVGLFYLTLLPQFLPADAKSGTAFGLAGLHVGIALTWFLVLSALTGGIRPWLNRPAVMAAVDRTTGGVFMLLSLQLILLSGLHA
ncbi:LysE family translocator [Brevundimonas sp.]|jgi:threonine/homoserine/homoserine lactone efflux protein|uniref:LysE family translocator n=1 Tax=Brevundimonas sp. TaxID=1871086 RepID=UPI0037BE3DA7